MSYTRLMLAQLGVGQAGLVGTVGYALYNADGSLNTPRTTAGVTERPAGSGTYAAAVAFADGFAGEVRWDTGGGTPKYASEAVNPDELDRAGGVEAGVTLRQAVQRIGATTAGKLSGSQTDTEAFVGLDGVTT